MLQARELPQVTVPEVLLPFNESQARLNIEKAAYLGFAKAQLKMGAAYELCSLGCEFDPAMSIHYNSLAAKQGESEAEMAISKWFLCGYEGVFMKNDEMAYRYALRAAQAGLPTAEFAMGYFNEIGMYTIVSIDQAREWYEKAAKNGNQDAISRIESLKQQNTLSKRDHENVAINRIRSQYGSKRGGRPERLKAQIPGLPSVSDEPEFSRPNSSGQRIGTAVPYPMTDTPLPMDGRGSAAPYPMDNAPPHGRAGPPGPAGGFFAGGSPDPRSQSAVYQHHQRQSSGGYGGSSQGFGINPNLYPQGGQRPSTTVNDGRGRSPVHRPNTAGYGGPQGYPDHRQASLSPTHASQGSMQDLGYVAPLNPRRTPGHSPIPSPVSSAHPDQYGRPPPWRQQAYGRPGRPRKGTSSPSRTAAARRCRTRSSRSPPWRSIRPSRSCTSTGQSTE